MVRFSRYFFILFLTVTVLPNLLFFFWNQYNGDRMMQERHRQVLNMAKENVTYQYNRYLQDETEYAKRLTKSLGNQRLSLAEYQAMFGASDAAWLPKFSSPDVISEYEMNANKPVVRFHIALAASNPKSLLIEKEVPLESLRPRGPFQVDIYKGVDKTQAALINTFKDMPMFAPGQNHPPHHSGLLAPPPPPPPEPSKQGRTVLIYNSQHQPVMTIVVRNFMPPRFGGLPPHFAMLGPVLLLTGFLSSLLAGHYLKRNFIDPLLKLSVATEAVQQGNLNIRVETNATRQADIQNVLEQFNKMVVDLSEKEALRRNFITNLSHDFKTPLIAQERVLDIFSDQFSRVDNPELMKLTQSMIKNNKYLLDMVNQLLETYQFESGKLRLTQGKTNISDITAECFSQVESIAKERNIELVKVFPDNFPLVNADSHYFKRVLLNLLGNAIENIPKGSTIKVSGLVSGNNVDIHVWDNGQGLDESIREHLFERYAGGYGDTRKIGSGLGLYICKMIVEAHQGQISVDSMPGEFTDFKISLSTSPTGGEASA